MKSTNLTAVYVEGEFGYTAYIDEMRGVITQGETIEDAEANLFDALQTYLEPDEAITSIIDSQSPGIRRNFAMLVKQA